MNISELLHISKAYGIKSAKVLSTQKEVWEGTVTIRKLSERHKLTYRRAYSLYRKLKKKPDGLNE